MRTRFALAALALWGASVLRAQDEEKIKKLFEDAIGSMGG